MLLRFNNIAPNVHSWRTHGGGLKVARAQVACIATATTTRPTGAPGVLGLLNNHKEVSPGNQEVPVMTKPAALDSIRFVLDDSVAKWRWYGAYGPPPDTAGLKPSMTDLLSKAAALSGHDAQSAAYWAYHLSRFTFFVTQGVSGLWAHDLSEQLDGAGREQPGTDAPSTPMTRLLKNSGSELTNRLWEGFGTWEQDYENIRAGVYNLPWDMTTPNKQFNPLVMARRTLSFMAESTATLRRRVRGKAEPVWLQSDMYPQYYKNTYHYQTDGWLSDKSANNYEHSTETLFLGRQDAMQRSALVPISNYIRDSSKSASELRLLEVAAGTGRFHTFVKDNWPAMRSVCSDLSPFYLQRARTNMIEWKRLRQPNKWLGGADDTGVEFVQMAAEGLSAPDNSFDIVVSVYLFHELPEPVRKKAAAEFMRVLKPGGLVVLTDSGQLGDRPEFDATMGLFGDFNEPWYRSYIGQDLGAMFAEVGFAPGTKWVVSSTKTLSFTKPL